MKKMIAKTTFLIFMCAMLAGCWSSRELTDLAIGTALAIDTHEDGYQVTVQVINPGEVAGDVNTTRTAVSTYTATGKTFFEALRKLTTTTPRKVFLSHLRLIVFGNELAEKGIRKPLDFISRDHQMRTDFAIAIAKDMRGEELIRILSPLEKIPANKVFTGIQASHNNWAPTKLVTVDELIRSITIEGKEAVLTGIYATGDPDYGDKLENVEQVDTPVVLTINHIGVFQGDKVVGWLNEKESKGLNYVTDDIQNTVGWVACDQGGTITFELMRSTTDLKPSVTNGQAKMEVNIKSEVNIADVECPINLSEPSTIAELEKKIEERQKELVHSSIAAAQKYHSDIFGFGERISQTFPKEWEKLKQDWSNQFTELDVTVHADAKIKGTGTITDTFITDIESKNK